VMYVTPKLASLAGREPMGRAHGDPGGDFTADE
jgi:hypothetical protein